MLDGGPAVIGAFHTPVRRQVFDQSLEEMIFAAARGALLDANLTIEDIDAVVLSTSDQVEGRVIESMVTNGAAGGVGRDVTTIASAGEHAFAYACLRILAGQARRILVVVWSKESEGTDPSHADRLSAEPFLLRPLGMTTPAAAGLQASAYCAKYALDPADVAAVRAARESAATAAVGTTPVSDGDAMVAWPLAVHDLPRGCDLAAAVVLAAPGEVTNVHTPAWVNGVGWISSSYELADRDLSTFAALEEAAVMALGDGRAHNVDLVEVQEISSIGSFAACEALGLAGPGLGATVAARGSATPDGAPVVNPSGGNLPANPGNAAGFMRLLSAAQQIRGNAGAVQLTPRPRSAVGAALNGFAGQSATVVLFTSDPEGVS